MAEYYTKAESDARYAGTSHTHALDDLGGELGADCVVVPTNASALFEDAYSMDEALYSIADQLAGKAAADHTHENLTVTPAAHTHAQSEVTGLETRLTEIEADITALQSAGGSAAVTPMVVASMHLGKLDNNSGAEVTSASRICSDPFAVENGKSYWQVNDKEVNMYVLIYDADEVFLAYLGNFASGAEIEVNNANAAYMRISSLVGEYDLTNEFRIYDEDPASGGGTEEEAFTQADADLLYAPISHTHTEYAAAEHTHDGYAPASHTHGEYFGDDPVNTISGEFTGSGIGTRFCSLSQETIHPMNIVSVSALVYFSHFPLPIDTTEPRAYTLPVRDESGDFVMTGYIDPFGKLVVNTSKDLGSYTVKAIYKYIPEAN